MCFFQLGKACIIFYLFYETICIYPCGRIQSLGISRVMDIDSINKGAEHHIKGFWLVKRMLDYFVKEITLL